MNDRFLEERKILLLDDDYLAALDMRMTIERLGGIVLGPVGRLDQAQELARAEQPDGAILVIRLDSRTSYPLARELLEQGVIVVILTGLEPRSIEPEFREIPRISKPYEPRRGEQVLRDAFR